ncbi:MAG TPA: tetratricopeptide repeat protein [bacterium]|nr:tetratricopeptide repeat protein [bacterium]
MEHRVMKLTAILGLLAIVLAGCGPKPVTPESILDTPDNHYSQGLRKLDAGDFGGAERSFNRATDLNPNYPGGYVGLALIRGKEGDFKEALNLVNRGISKDDKFIDGHIAKGRILTMEKKGDNWLKEALKPFERALKLDAESEKAHYYRGVAYKEAFEFGDAVSAFARVISLKGDFSGKANQEWELVQKIQRAAPGTRVGAKIALIPEISRADVAVLFLEEMKLMEIIEKRQPKTWDTRFRPPDDPMAMKAREREQLPPATDIEDHWAKTWIEDVIKAGVIDVFPDHTFHPNEKITRANYAQFLQSCLILVTGDQSLATKYIGGGTQRFPDINPSHYAYNAICLAVDRGIMKANTIDGSFGLSDPVSGADALLIIRDFQNHLRMTF